MAAFTTAYFGGYYLMLLGVVPSFKSGEGGAHYGRAWQYGVHRLEIQCPGFVCQSLV
jgi:hypothetical protein